ALLCGNGVLDPLELCDDGNTVDGDGCDPTCMPSGCSTGASALVINDNPDDVQDAFSWSWKAGAATGPPVLRDPVNGSASYRLRPYAASGGSQPLRELSVPAGGTCGTVPCWKPVAQTGFRYRNDAATPDGITTLTLKSNRMGKMSIPVKGKGPALPTPTL